LIFNTTNNTFEVYKTACSCWVTINDGGNTSASNKLNTAPEASFLNYKGSFRPNGTAEIFYTYVDADGDAEGGTSFFWEIANDANGGSKTTLSTGATATFLPDYAAKYVRAIVTPRATKGLLNGNNYYGPWTLIEAATIPFASGVSITGTAAQGNLLTGNYTFNGGSGTENGAGSTYIWQSATSSTGTNAQTIAIPDGGFAFDKTLVPTFTEINKYVRFGVNAKDNASVTASSFVYSDWIGPIILGQEAAPIAKNVTYNSKPAVGLPLTASYTYYDANNDAEGTSVFQWYTANNAIGTGKTPISGANAKQFTPTDAQDGLYIGLGVTAKALTGTITGTEVVYFNPNPTTLLAQFSIAPNAISISSNNFYTGRVMGATDKITAKINVTSPGKLSFSTNTVNGYSFSANGSYPVGEQNVTLTATGTQISYTNGDPFTITISGMSSSTVTTTIKNVKLGKQFIDHFNGIESSAGHNTIDVTNATYYLKTSYTTGETFDKSTVCSDKPISTSTCEGTSITVGSNTYSITSINGQCWMAQNLKELPNGVAVSTSSFGSTLEKDIGAYGFYNVTTPSAKLWGTSEPAAGEGLLYQWSAAMGGLEGLANERTKGICPTGWHIPSDCEFLYLEHGLGLSLVSTTSTGGNRGDAISEGVIGSKMSNYTSSGTNSSGFSGILAGKYQNSDGFSQRKSTTGFWTSTDTGITTAAHYLESNRTLIARYYFEKPEAAFSIRCLKD
jgi:uncharacterized protein (TIGR02145 family)